ncbi:MAG TPA: tetratricopeptide repeat protein, partial [Thermoanaerobaculia bacterium]|nr:tetratricopeptide repeat protein [Thermoanaerobaculia bacterium]
YANYPTRTAAEAFEARDGNCLSLVNLYLALARSAGLEAFPVEVEDFEVFSRRGGAVVRSTHVVGGLLVNAEVMIIDFLPDRPKAYRRVARIDDDRQAALTYNAVATEAMLHDGDLERAAGLYRAALAYQQDNAEAWNNYAVLARRAGDTAEARRRFERALSLDAGFLPSLNNLAALHRAEGRRADAEALEARALDQKRQSPYFLASQAMRRMALSDLDGAEGLLQRARRIESDIPEVHLALGRVDLARGDANAAERHFERARRTSRELSDRYRNKMERKIGKLTHLASAG